jgi:P4 family phage/plasmid primase-like protien
MKYFAKKITAVKHLTPSQIICNKGLKRYFILDNYSLFLSLIKNTENPDFYEVVLENSPVNLFFDIEVYREKNKDLFDKCSELISSLKNHIYNLLDENYNIKVIVLESHTSLNETNPKKSYHIIAKFINKENGNYGVFQNVKLLKQHIDYYFPENCKDIIDKSVYREGLFRTIYSSKNNEIRPLVKSELSDDFIDIDTFVCNCNSDEIEYIELDQIPSDNEITNIQTGIVELTDMVNTEISQNDKAIIIRFIQNSFKCKMSDIRDIIIDPKLNCIVIALNERYCFNINREHKSNHQYIVIDVHSAKQKCHDFNCKEYKYNEININEYPQELYNILIKYLKNNKNELELIEKAKMECKDYITKNFDENVEDIQFDKNEMLFKSLASDNSLIKMMGKCVSCKLEHHITNIGYCLKCSVCQMIYPKNQLIPIEDKYSNLNSFWNNYTQLINNGTVNINIQNYYNAEEEFNCDIQLENGIFKNKELTKLLNQVLDGHKVTKLAEVIYCLNKDFIYTKNNWYYFNGSIWKQDEDNLEMKKSILDSCGQFNKITNYYQNKKTSDISITLIKNIKNLINKLNKPGFKDDIIKEAKMFYNDTSFLYNLNSKKHLVPFINGVYDLLKNEYRKTKKEDYINLTVNFNYDQSVHNQEVYTFINNILPNKGVRDYVLKKMSECLNGDIPNTNFLMFIGDGANGKSQLLNLMKITMGELGEKVEVTLLTRKRNNANEANSEKIKLMHKRFAFLSEPEDREKINIGLLKELTGSEEIVARGLYQESMSFVMEAKLFLACNELPEIKGEDTALWRRIRVIDFPSRFVDEPKEDNEFKIDRTLPSRMREDLTWRQTFMNILLSYYYKTVSEPLEVQIKTNEYRQENNDFYNWLEENIEEKEGELLQLKEICQTFLSKTKVHSSLSTKYRKEIERYIKERYPHIKWEFQHVWINEKSVKGWKNLQLKV